MAALIPQGDIDYLQQVFPDIEIKPPTGQQEQLILNYFRGMTIPKAAESAGYRDIGWARKYLQSPGAQAILGLLREREFEDVRITVDSITGMFMEAYHMSATATEKIAAARELGKLHGLYPDQKKGVEVNITQNNIGTANVKQLQRLSDEEIAAALGPEMLSLIHEGEFEVVPEDDA